MSCSMQTDGQTEMTMLVVAFRNFANASKNIQYLLFFMDVKLVFVLGREKKTTKLEAS